MWRKRALGITIASKCDALNASIAALVDDDAFANRTSLYCALVGFWHFLSAESLVPPYFAQQMVLVLY